MFTVSICYTLILLHFASGAYFSGPAGHLLTPALAYVRRLQDIQGASKRPPTN